MPVRIEFKSTRSRFFIPQVRDRINRRARENVNRAAEQLLEDARGNITQAHSPPASRPGQFPHTNTGDLAHSGHTEQLNDAGGIWSAVVFSARHAGFVEKMRPFLFRTAKQNKKRYAGSLIKRLFDRFGF